jgi:hypothetical protein
VNAAGLIFSADCCTWRRRRMPLQADRILADAADTLR